MYNQPYFIPRYFPSPSMMRGAMNGAMLGARGAMNGARLGAGAAGRGLGLFGRLGNSFAALRGINWGGLITNASKTLNVVNQAIPLVRQVGPMVNNMRSMLRVASIFKDETDIKPVQKKNQTTEINNNTNHKNETNDHSHFTNHSTSTESKGQTDYHNFNYSDASPTFFIH